MMLNTVNSDEYWTFVPADVFAVIIGVGVIAAVVGFLGIIRIATHSKNETLGFLCALLAVAGIGASAYGITLPVDDNGNMRSQSFIAWTEEEYDLVVSYEDYNSLMNTTRAYRYSTVRAVVLERGSETLTLILLPKSGDPDSYYLVDYATGKPLERSK